MFDPSEIGYEDTRPDFNRFPEKRHPLLLEIKVGLLEIFNEEPDVCQAEIALILIRAREPARRGKIVE